jgi:cyclophilin family peptidyl-prolyl cis-trans isomerase
LKLTVWILALFFSSSLFAANNSVVIIETPLGSFQMELLSDEAPNTVQNFLNYVERGDYDSTFFHRSVPGFVVQGGGFSYDPATNTAPPIPLDPPVVNEFGVSNVRGTVAMAKTAAGPNTATSQWFVNLSDNSTNLDNQNGGFTVFARVIGDGMQVVDAIANLPLVNLDGGGVFSSTPTIDFSGSVNASIFVTINKASVTSDPDFDGDGTPDSTDADDDNDGVPDVSDAFPKNVAEFADTDNDGTGNNEDTDDDGDGVLDTADDFPLDSSETTDTDGDGVGDNADTNTAIRLDPNKTIELSVIGASLSSPSGGALTVPNTATAVSINVTVVSPNAAGFITVYPCGVTRPLASNVNFIAGQVVPNGVIAAIGNNGKVCFYASQTTDIIVDVAGWFTGESFIGATPKRLVDSRDGTGTAVAKLTSATPLAVQITNLSVTTATGSSTTIPTNISAAALNVTVVNPEAAGFITVYPCDVTRPNASNVNFVSDQVVANGVVAPVSTSGQVCLFSSVPTDIIVDLAGWLGGSSFTGATPKRLVDTRDGTGGLSRQLTNTDELSVAIRSIDLTVSGSTQSVPVGATAAALNVTVVSPSGAGFVTVYPCGVTRPLSSNLNYVAGDVVANNVVAPIGSNGNVCLFTSSDTDIIVDVAGYFSGDATNGFVGSTPKRLVDTRDGTGPVPQ